MSFNKKFISKEELETIKDFKMRKSFTALLADKYIVENQKADLEYSNLILKLYVKHGLSTNDSIDDKSGEIFVFAEKETVESKQDVTDKVKQVGEEQNKVDTENLEVPNITNQSSSKTNDQLELDWHA